MAEMVSRLVSPSYNDLTPYRSDRIIWTINPAPSPSRSKKIPTILSTVKSSRRTENRTTEKAKRAKKGEESDIRSG